MNMPRGEMKGEKEDHLAETEPSFPMGEEIWLNQYYLSAQPSRILAL